MLYEFPSRGNAVNRSHHLRYFVTGLLFIIGYRFSFVLKKTWSLYKGRSSSKRFQSSYCAKVRVEAKNNPSFPSPSPVIPFFFLLSSRRSRRTRVETLATQAIIHMNKNLRIFLFIILLQ